MSSNVHFQSPRVGYAAPYQGLSGTQSRWVIAAIVLIHLAIVWGLLQIKAIREVAIEAAPMFFEVVADSPTPPAPRPAQVIKKVSPPTPIISTPVPEVSNFVAATPEVQQPIEAPEPVSVPTQPVPPTASPPPKMIPASAIKYLVPPQMVYPRASRPFRESGRVLTRVYVDEAGMPREVQINKSSGFPRLDQAAIEAVQKARFKPYTENGEPMAGWALIPLNFELE